MSVLVANPHLLHRELCHRDCPQPHPSSGGGCSSLPVHGRGFYTETGRRSWRPRGELKAAAAFWHDLSKPTSIEMEHISGVEELDQILLRSKKLSELIIIDWMAAWCRKCIYLKPKLEKLAAEYHPRVKFYFVDVNKVPQALVKRGNVSKMPTIQLWKDGECKAEVIGGHKAWLVLDEVREMIQKYK